MDEDTSATHHHAAGRTAGPAGVVLRDPVYRSMFLILVAQGVVFGSQMPFMPLWAQDRLGAGTIEVGVVGVVASIVSTIFGFAYGMATDRTRRRVAWLVAAYGLAIPLRIFLAYVTDLTVGAAAYAIASMAMFVLHFAILGDWFRYRNEPRGAEITNIVRLGFTSGWLIGSFGAGWWVARFGYDGLYLATAALQVLSFVLLVVGVRDAPIQSDPVARSAGGGIADPETWREFSRPEVAWYLASTVCMGAAGVARMTLLPLYLREAVTAEGEALGTEAIGMVFGIETVWEIPVALLAGAVVRRVGVSRVLQAGIVASVMYFAAVAATSTFLPFMVIEALYATVVTTTFGFGIVHMQHMIPDRGGTAIAMYNAAGTVGPVFAAPLLGWVAVEIGWTAMFAMASMLSVAAFWAFTMSERVSRTNRLLRSESVQNLGTA